MADVVAEIRRAGGSTNSLRPNLAQGWDMVINGPTGSVTVPSNALDNPARDQHLATFYSDAVQQSLSEVDLVPSREFAAQWGFTRELPTPDVAVADLKKAIFEGQYRYIQNTDSEGRLVLIVDPRPDTGDMSFTSRESNGDPEQATFDPVPVQDFFRRLNVEPEAAFAAEYPHAVPYQYRPSLNPAAAPATDPIPPPSVREQSQQEGDDPNAVDTQNAMDVLDQAEQQGREQQEQEEIRREAEQRRAEQTELDRQQAERTEQQGERGGKV